VLTSSLADPSACARELLARGFVHSRAEHSNKAMAWESAREVFRAAAEADPIGLDMPPLEVVGEFTVPPVGALRRDRPSDLIHRARRGNVGLLSRLAREGGSPPGNDSESAARLGTY
jgi:hypothetical protein